MHQEYQQRLLEEEQEKIAKNSQTIELFKKHCANLGLQLTNGNFKYIRTIGIVAFYPNLLSFLNSSIQEDKEGLVNCELLDRQVDKQEQTSGFLIRTNYLMLAHPYFRRGFNENANFAPSFIDLFWGLRKLELDLFIALDFNRVRIDLNGSTYVERDTWYGAKFNKEIHSIADDVSKLRPPLDLGKSRISRFFSHAYSLDTIWETKDGIKTFQAEEFKNEEIKILINGEDYYPVRYIHAEYDLKKESFRHFDGAIHLYNENEYYQRRDSDFNYNSKHLFQIKSNSRKLFKMNGNVNVDTFVVFTSHFFTGNPLIFEYFEGEYPAYIKEMIDKVRLVNINNSQPGANTA